MKILIIKIIQKFFNFFGFYILQIRHKDYGFNQILSKLINNNPIIFDVGAEDGSSCERYLKIFKSPFIHSFEPRKDKYEIMCEKFKNNNNIFLNNLGVGSVNEIREFYQIDNGGRSSFLKSTVDDVNNQKKINTKLITIDSYLKNNKIKKINLLKIDVQGFEDEVLNGAKEILKNQNIDVIELELIVGNMYEKTLSFSNIENIILPYGYKFFGITNHQVLDQHSSNIMIMPSLQFDIIYTKYEIFNKYANEENFIKRSIFKNNFQSYEQYKKNKLSIK